MERMRGTRDHMAESTGVLPTRSDPRVLLLACPGLTSVAVTLTLPAIHQWGRYHNFADTRGFRYLPNALNVLSNMPFLIVGALGSVRGASSRGACNEAWCDQGRSRWCR